MLYPILAKLGIPWAKKHKAMTDEKILRNALVALGKPGVQLSAEAVRTIRGYTTEAIEAEYERDLLKLDNRYHERRAKVGLVQCADVGGAGRTNELNEIAAREGMDGAIPRRKTKPEPEPEPQSEGEANDHETHQL